MISHDEIESLCLHALSHDNHSLPYPNAMAVLTSDVAVP